jgi:hypothetical protein
MSVSRCASNRRADQQAHRHLPGTPMNARDGKWLTTAGLVLVRQNGEVQIAYDQSGFVYSLDVPLASIAAAL